MTILYDIFRLMIYAWATIEAFLLFHLYSYGFENFKKSKIIGTLSLLFAAIGTYIFFVFLMAVARIIDGEFYIYISQFTFVFVLLVGICLKCFREESLRKPKK